MVDNILPKNEQTEVARDAAHNIRKNMAGLLEKNPTIWKEVIAALETNDKEKFKDACIAARITKVQGVIDDENIFIDQLWKAAKAARQGQSMQPCW